MDLSLFNAFSALSSAKGAASVGASIPVDLAGNARMSPPDLGAYQHVIVED